jgi:uncharacterized BrkB/YihY/UPF0761 family membrane protein
MSPSRQSLVTFSKTFFQGVADHDLLALAAAIAYYTTLCLAPLLLLSLAVIGALYPSAQERFLADVGALVGADGEQVIRNIVESSRERPDLRQMRAGSVPACCCSAPPPCSRNCSSR